MVTRIKAEKTLQSYTYLKSSLISCPSSISSSPLYFLILKLQGRAMSLRCCAVARTSDGSACVPVLELHMALRTAGAPKQHRACSN